MSTPTDVNLWQWNRRDIVRTYNGRRYVTPAEVRVLATCWDRVRGGTVLDVGVGAGRTVPYVAPFAARYVGVDVMPNMVAQARRAFPDREILQADARNLPFEQGTFSFVLFSFNGIDYVAPGDRAKVLGEVRRVLTPGGSFAYSTHNLASRGATGFVPADVRVNPSRPLRSAVAIARAVGATVRGYRNYRRLAAQEQVSDEIAFVNDGAHEYSLLTCYVTMAHERRALAAAGFEVRAVIDPDGQSASDGSRARDLYFVAE